MKRILLKLSGEALAGGEKQGFNEKVVTEIGRQVKILVENKIEVGIVIGGGNFWRGRSNSTIDRTKADQIGMLATVMNCLYVSESMRTIGLESEIMTPFSIGSISKTFSKFDCLEHMKKGKVIFFAGGTGHPYFSTDTATALRAIEIEADIIFLAKNIDCVYDKDPASHKDAKKYTEMSMDRLIDDRLKVIDMSAALLCKENKMPMFVFALNKKNSIVRAVNGEIEGTHIRV